MWKNHPNEITYVLILSDGGEMHTKKEGKLPESLAHTGDKSTNALLLAHIKIIYVLKLFSLLRRHPVRHASCSCFFDGPNPMWLVDPDGWPFSSREKKLRI